MACCKDTNPKAVITNSCACAEARARTPTLHSNTGAPSVPLPSRNRLTTAGIGNSNTPPIWAITNVHDEPYADGDGERSPLLVAPLPTKCDRHADDRHGVCCKDLKGEDERTLVDPDVVRDVVIGLSDGLTVPFALTAGLSSIGDSKLVVIGGVAELIAGAISMGVGGFLASQAERDHFRYLRTQTRERVKRSCEGEMEREVHAVLGPLGVEEKLSRDIADSLRRVEEEVCGSDGTSTPGSRVPSRSPHSREGTLVNGEGYGSMGDSESGKELKWSNDVGLTAFLLKFGEGMEEVPTRRLYISAFTIGMGYFVGGLVPLIPYFFIDQARTALVYSCIVTGIILLIFGAVKTHVTGATGGIGGYIWGAVSMLAVGGGAAAAAYGIVAALERS